MNIVRTKLKDFNLSEKLRALSESARTTVAAATISRHQAESQKLDESYSAESNLEYDAYTTASQAMLESLRLSLSRYSHDSRIDQFLKECAAFVSDNAMHLMIESAIQRLSTSRDKPAFKSAIESLRKASNSEAPAFYIKENLASSRWVPSVDFLYSQSLQSVGSIDDSKSPFTVSKIVSVVEKVDGSALFFSNGLVLESNGKDIKVSEKRPSEKSIELQKVLESCRFDGDRITCYPNRRTTVSHDFASNEYFVNGAKSDPTTIQSRLLANGLARLDEMSTVDAFMELVSESSPMTEIDFGYRVDSNNGQKSASVYKVNGEVFLQKKDRNMGTNSIERMPVNESIDAVKSFMEYDISESVKELLPVEQKKAVDHSAEIKKLEERINYAEKKLESLVSIEKSGTVNEANIEKARKLLNDIISESKTRISKLTAVNEEATKISVDDKGTKVEGQGEREQAINAGEEHSDPDKEMPEKVGEDGGKEGETPKA